LQQFLAESVYYSSFLLLLTPRTPLLKVVLIWMMILVKMSNSFTLRCVLGGIAIVLYFFSPYDYGIYPKCPFKILTGSDCLFCGSTRAVYHFLHLDFIKAWQLNPLMILSIFAFLGWWIFQKIKTL
jgi:hypothetical protein